VKKFSKIAHFIFNLGDLKLQDLAKVWFFKLIMTKSNFKKTRYDVISVTSSLFHHPKNVTKLMSQDFSISDLSQSISGYAST